MNSYVTKKQTILSILIYTFNVILDLNKLIGLKLALKTTSYGKKSCNRLSMESSGGVI